jgi:Zn-dependent M32 family carboxypeptidase
MRAVCPPHLGNKAAKSFHTHLWRAARKDENFSSITRRCTKAVFLSRVFNVEFPTKMMSFDRVIHTSAQLSTKKRHLSTVFSWLGEKWTYSP